MNQVIEQLYRDSGLDLYHEQDITQEPSVRLTRALELAQKRFDAMPETERVLPPAEAVVALSRVIFPRVIFLGLLRTSFELDMEFLESLPSLSPLAILSPAFGIVQKNVVNAIHLQAGRSLECRKAALEILDRLSQEDRAGLQDTVHTQMRLILIYLLGAVEVNLGIASANKWIEEIEKTPYYRIYAWRLRILDALRQGDIEKAEKAKKRVELLQIQSHPAQNAERTLLWLELQAYCAFDDVVRVEQTIPKLEECAANVEGWVPCLHFARGQLKRMRGDHRAAFGELESALQRAQPGRHLAWALIAGAYLTTLFDLGEVERARDLGRGFLEICQRENLDVKMVHIAQPLALAEAALDDYERAIEHAQAAVDMLDTIGATAIEKLDDVKADTSWKNSEGQRFVPVKLGHPTDNGNLVTGVAVLRTEAIYEFDFPTRLLSILSKSLLDSRDITNAILME